LPPLPALTNVVATLREDSVGIEFDPVDDAVDYRVYPLPKDGDVTTNTDGSVVIKNAVYRCAGLRQPHTGLRDRGHGQAHPTLYSTVHAYIRTSVASLRRAQGVD